MNAVAAVERPATPPSVGDVLQFWLTVPEPAWLAYDGMPPMMVTAHRLARYATLPQATQTYCVDSSAYTELGLHGEWRLSPADYVALLRRTQDEAGPFAWCACQDWPVEEEMLRATGLTPQEHQRRSLDNYLELADLAPDLPWVPVVHGVTNGMYLRHRDAYARHVDLDALPVVGLGSVCKRQTSIRVSLLVTQLFEEGLQNMHAFGMKSVALQRLGRKLLSADSMAWSTAATYEPPMPGHTHKSCSSCPDFAAQWAEHITSLPLVA